MSFIHNIITWNCNGLRATADSSNSKMDFFDKEFPNGSFGIAAFIETHHRDIDDFPDKLKEYEPTHNFFHTPAPVEHPHRGIILLVHKKFKVVSWKVQIQGRLLNLQYRDEVEDKVFNLSAFYGPVQRDVVSAEVEGLVQHFYYLHHATQNNIILGDFNFIDNPLDKGKGLDGHDKMICRFWDDFKKLSRVSDPYREQYPSAKTFSYHSHHGKSRGDRVYVSDNFICGVSNIKYTYYPQANTHKLLSFKIDSSQEKGPGYWKLNTSVLNDAAYIKVVTDSISELKNYHCQNPTGWWELLLITVRSLSVNYCQRKRYLEKEVKRSWTRELVELEAVPVQALTQNKLARLKTVQERLKLLEEQEVEGHRIRSRLVPKYEHSDPNISFYAKLEKRSIQKNTITHLYDKTGVKKSNSKDLLDITSKFYTSLYTASNTDPTCQKKLLKNIKNTFTSAQKEVLDAPISQEELEEAVFSLNEDKSPGLTGLPAEFYKKFWPYLKDRYLLFINFCFLHGFPVSLNTAVTTLIYKNKGDSHDIANYRPISLIATDIKILSKALTNRIKPLMPTVIHKSQTATFNRRIDHTIHLLRDLIELSNHEELDAAFIFLDQEKAFDRVDHKFLFQTLKSFGIGGNFITWIQQIYASAKTRVKVNGFLTTPISLMRGVRQGDPLSFLLYLFNIELFALQLRHNPNIVGFTIVNEKIVSMHYADDTTICITQNRCFKEVIKDISLFEQATGAKVNLGKTKGLWAGSWKNRADCPLDIDWTSENIFHLGIFFGNDSPAVKTFEKICPKIHKGLDYWKSFRLCSLSKARVIETFHASRLWYAARFYCIPPDQVKLLQKSFLDYINFPRKQSSICGSELQKLLADGGIKLTNIKLKSEASKIQWLMSLCINSELSLHKALMERLLGTQRGNILGIELLFQKTPYIRHIMRIPSHFYKEAFLAASTLDVRKKIFDVREEKIFYNKTFVDEFENTFNLTQFCLDNSIYTLGPLLDESERRDLGLSYERRLTDLLDKIKDADVEGRDDFIIDTSAGFLPFQKVTQKILYEQLLKCNVYRVHHSEVKWVTRLDMPLDWEKLWTTVHSPIASNSLKTSIWSQLHLNDYTTATYNRMFADNDLCPLCNTPCVDRFHIILDCPTVQTLWSDIEPFLTGIYYNAITDHEMAFGIVGNTPYIVLRNWLTFLLRDVIRTFERQAFHNNLGEDNAVHIRHAYNARVQREVMRSFITYKNLQRQDFFFKYFNPNGRFLLDVEGELKYANIPKVFNI